MRRLLLLLATVSFSATAQQLPLTQKLGVDPAIVMGTLPNGMKYFIRKNIEPAKRAELRLAVNAGSVLEADDQRGYAHFLEHTAFNGTTHFKKNDLVKYLQSIGVQFGADLNAYTGFDETVYQLSIPTDTAKQVEQAFQILEDWAHGQLFDSTEVVNERGVVQEEWRGRLGAGSRMLEAALPIILKGSIYAQRLPIGTQESIMRAQPSVLRRFYTDWYRPDLMAVMAVGDFDVPTIEALIKKHFTGVAKVANPKPRVEPAVPNNVQPLVAITTDPEQTSSNISIDIKHPSRSVTTVGDYRRNLAEALYFRIINARLTEIERKPNAPFLDGSVSSGGFIGRSVEALSFNASVKDGEIERGIEAVLMEVKRVDQFGFLQPELDRAKLNIERSYQAMYDERAKTHSAGFVDELVRHFLEGEHIPGIEAEYALTKQLLPTITLADVNTLAREWITDENRVIWISAPQKAGVSVPTEAQILAVIDRASKAPVVAYVENLGDTPLIEKLAAPGRVVSTKTTPEVNVTEWKLSNGARVLLKPTDFKADEVVFSAYSPGGHSLVSDADYMSASSASAIIGASGLGSYNTTDLGKKLAGKAASVSASIGQTSEGLGGGGSPKDIETLFQLIYLKFTAPRLDMDMWGAMKAQTEQFLANRGLAPQSAFADTLTVELFQHHIRFRPPSVASFNQINPQRALEIYKDRFANAGDFTFVFVGSFSLDSIKPLVEKYIASLPGTGRVENFKDIGDTRPAGIVDKTVYKGTEPVAISRFTFTSPFVYNVANRVEFNALVTLADMWLTDGLREELGGTYSPQIGGGPSRVPRQEAQIDVQYQSSPDNVAKLSAKVFAIIDSLKKTGPNDADLVKVKEQILRGRETSLKENGYWLSSIQTRDNAGENITGILNEFDDLVKQLTPAKLREAANKYFDTKRYVKVVLLPEKKAQ